MLMGVLAIWEVLSFQKFLDDFTIASVMDIKSQIFKIFFFNTPPYLYCHLTNILGFNKGTFPTTYLGAPLAPNSLRTKIWSNLIQKITN